MKKLLITTAIIAGFTASVFAQGTVQFVLNGAGFKAPVYGPELGADTVSKSGNTTAGLPAGTQVYTGVLLTTGYMAQMFGAVGAVADSASLQAALPVTTFRTGSAGGLTAASVNATFSNIPLDAPLATVQIRAWDNRTGAYPTWAQAEIAWRAGTIAAGVSALAQVAAVGGQANTPPIASNLQSFNIYFIPEPTVMALAGLGAAGLLIFRRRN